MPNTQDTRAITLHQVEIPMERIRIEENGCWVWTGAKSDEGYGLLQLSGKRESRQYVHRLMYQIFVGPFSSAFREIDHLCRNRACCNPAHLEAVSSYENSLRGNHPLFAIHRSGKCRNGHDMDNAENVHFRKDGRRRCRLCDNATRQRARDRRTA